MVGLHPRIAGGREMQVACGSCVYELVNREEGLVWQLLPPADDAATLPLVNDPPGVQDGYRTAAKERLDLSASKFLPALACEGDLARVLTSR
jgi:hypothetical protein